MKAPDQPPHDCPLCPRLAAFRDANRQRYPDWFNGPVPSFGPLNANQAPSTDSSCQQKGLKYQLPVGNEGRLQSNTRDAT